jgi:hypothetical protein
MLLQFIRMTPCEHLPVCEQGPSFHRFLLVAAVIGAIPFVSFAAQRSGPALLPPETSFTEEAGRGGFLRIKVRLETGEELQTIVDTGARVSIFKSSWVPRLGKPAGTVILDNGNTRLTNKAYAAPKLFLGDTRLLTGPVCFTRAKAEDQSDEDLLLGLDVLRNYCFQLDFDARKIRFLDPQSPDTVCGEAFRLSFSKDGHLVAHEKFLDVRNFHIDTGAPFDGVVAEAGFQRALRNHHVVPCAHKLNGRQSQVACFPEAVFGRNRYSDLFIVQEPGWSYPPGIIGLNFLARHLVTFNLPKKKMYLKQTTHGEPLDVAGYLTEQARELLQTLQAKGELPGWTNIVPGVRWALEGDASTNYPVSMTLKFETGASVDITSKIQSIVGGNAAVRVSNELAGQDPAPGVPKMLRVEFLTNGTRATLEAKEGEMLTLPTDCELVSARYGALLFSEAGYGSPSIRHYTLVRPDRGRAWQLKRAWRTNTEQKFVEEYPIDPPVRHTAH